MTLLTTCAAALLMAGPVGPQTSGQKAVKAVPIQAPQKAQRTYDQEKMKASYEDMLTHDWYKDGGWITDFAVAKTRAKESGKPIFAYFTRTYAP